MQFFRRIVFYLFVAIYIIICPLLLLYAYGYIYKPGIEKGLLTTGLIYVATAPTGSEIYVNDKKYAKNTPTAIMELLPGEYSIELKLDGYKTWSQTVPVAKEKATVLER
ncbi:PEGA domain-containing protein, partial [Candidatus Omnitrophota bacterium]